MKRTMHNTIHHARSGHNPAVAKLAQKGNLNFGCRINSHMPRRQDGVALIVSLVILMILTILGTAAMSTSSLELKMSGNAQTSTRALEGAESGLAEMFNSLTSLDPSQPQASQTYPYGSGATAVSAAVSLTFIETNKNIRGSGFGAGFQTHYFDQASVGTTAAALGGRATVHQGLSQIGSASQY